MRTQLRTVTVRIRDETVRDHLKTYLESHLKILSAPSEPLALERLDETIERWEEANEAIGVLVRDVT